jgi:beta-glucosidase
MTQQSPDGRIEALIAQMSLGEKIGQLTMVRGGGGAGGPQLSAEQLNDVRAGLIGSVLDISARTGIREAQEVAVKESRLGIPLLVCLDVLHGYETTFPIPLAEASAFDPALWEATARVAAEEAAAAEIALTFAPMIDASRDARWGRIAESPGEDPWLGARFAEAKIRGFQQASLASHRSVAATAKHLGAYGAVGSGREYNSVDISPRNLHEVHLPAFEAAVRAGVAAIMPAFNDLAGVPMTANTAILRGIVRERWGFEGVMVSDFSAVAELITHGVAADLVEAAALALKAGIDIDMVSDVYPKGLAVALERGLVEMRLVDEAVRRVLALKERLGLFDDPLRGHGGTASITPPQADTRRELARNAARRSIVLLQNRNDVLPLRGEPKHLAVLGPFAENKSEMLGPWYAKGTAEEMTSFLDGIRQALPGWKITHAAGGGIAEKDPASFALALEATRDADIVLMCLGEEVLMSGEAASRARPNLPTAQRQFAEAVFAWRKPVIVTLTSGRPITLPWLFQSADAVLATWFLGSEAGTGLADVLTGRFNPSGKLPVCWPVDVGQVPIFYAQRPTGRPLDPNNHMTSRYIDMPNDPLFCFGHGLSYTRFAYKGVRVSAPVLAKGGAVRVEADIVNEGGMAGEETALLFIRDPVASVTRPVLELKGMAKIALAPGAAGTVGFTLTAEDVCFPDDMGHPVFEAGTIEVMVGPKADHKELLKTAIEVQV